jgi:hypothetical protein
VKVQWETEESFFGGLVELFGEILFYGVNKRTLFHEEISVG